MSLTPIDWRPDTAKLAQFSEITMFLLGMVAAPSPTARSPDPRGRLLGRRSRLPTPRRLAAGRLEAGLPRPRPWPPGRSAGWSRTSPWPSSIMECSRRSPSSSACSAATRWLGASIVQGHNLLGAVPPGPRLDQYLRQF